MLENFQIQEWDSDFFGFKVVKVLDDFLAEETELKLESLHKKEAALIYYTSKESKFAEFDNSFYDVKLVSTRVPIIKKMTNLTEIHPNISLYDKLPPDEKLISLARSAGKHGRFGTDSRIPKEAFNEIFHHWIINSIKKVLAEEVLVYKEEGVIVGFATLKTKGNKGYAPLLAVDREYEGKGVSFALMRAIETRLVQYGCDYVMSGTQNINKKALAIFKRFGTEIQPPEYIYHLWKKN